MIRHLWSSAWYLVRNDGMQLAGYIAYTTLLSFFPFIIFLTALTGLFGDTETVQRSIGYLFEFTPPEIQDVLAPVLTEITGIKDSSFLTIGILGTLWATMSGVETLRLGMNRAYRVNETRSFIKNRLQSLFFVVAIAFGAMIITIAIVLTPIILEIISRYVPLPGIAGAPLQIGRYLIGIGVLFTMLCIIYYWLPNVRQRPRQVVPGAAVATLLWILLASSFSAYLSHANSYSVTYGSLSGIIITMLFLQISALIVMFGAEINYSVAAVNAAEKPVQA